MATIAESVTAAFDQLIVTAPAGVFGPSYDAAMVELPEMSLRIVFCPAPIVIAVVPNFATASWTQQLFATVVTATVGLASPVALFEASRPDT